MHRKYMFLAVIKLKICANLHTADRYALVRVSRGWRRDWWTPACLQHGSTLIGFMIYGRADPVALRNMDPRMSWEIMYHIWCTGRWVDITLPPVLCSALEYNDEFLQKVYTREMSWVVGQTRYWRVALRDLVRYFDLGNFINDVLLPPPTPDFDKIIDMIDAAGGMLNNYITLYHTLIHKFITCIHKKGVEDTLHRALDMGLFKRQRRYVFEVRTNQVHSAQRVSEILQKYSGSRIKIRIDWDQFTKVE